MRKETNLCMCCMSEKTGAICPVCGYSDETNTSPYLAPKTFLNGRYVVGKLFSYNGESGLYMGYDTMHNRKVTIREYIPDTLCNRDDDGESVVVKNERMPLYKAYLSEFVELNKTLMSLGGTTNIQPVLDVFEENHTAYAVMEFIVGMSLKTYLSNCGETLTWEQVKDLFPSTLTTLGIIHGMCIIHRGISPSTIFVTEKNELKLIGFDISASRTTDSDINCEVYAGYAPPELYSSARRNGSWTDVFGISAVLYRCLTGIEPPSAADRLIEDKIVEPMLINRSIPANVSRVIMKGLSLEVENRISSINEFVDRLFEQPSMDDYSTEFHVPAHRPAPKPVSSGAAKPVSAKPASKTIKRKKEQSDSAKKVMIVSILMGVIILVFLLAIFIPMFTDSEEKDEVNAAITTTTTTESVTETSAVTSATVVDADETTAADGEEGYILPDFTNRVYDTIKDSHKYSYLNIVPVYEFNNEYKNGMIFEQDIAADTRVTTGTTITLKVSKGAETIALPDYTGMSLNEYKEMLSELNVKYECEEYETDDFKTNYVVKCSFEIGETVNVAEGETVTVYYAVTPKVTTTTTPKVTDIVVPEDSAPVVTDPVVPSYSDSTITIPVIVDPLS